MDRAFMYVLDMVGGSNMYIHRSCEVGGGRSIREVPSEPHRPLGWHYYYQASIGGADLRRRPRDRACRFSGSLLEVPLWGRRVERLTDQPSRAGGQAATVREEAGALRVCRPIIRVRAGDGSRTCTGGAGALYIVASLSTWLRIV